MNNNNNIYCFFFSSKAKRKREGIQKHHWMKCVGKHNRNRRFFFAMLLWEYIFRAAMKLHIPQLIYICTDIVRTNKRYWKKHCDCEVIYWRKFIFTSLLFAWYIKCSIWIICKRNSKHSETWNIISTVTSTKIPYFCYGAWWFSNRNKNTCITVFILRKKNANDDGNDGIKD